MRDAGESACERLADRARWLRERASERVAARRSRLDLWRFAGSCAAALAHLRVRDELALDTNVRARSEQLFAGLRAIAGARRDIFDEPRGMGLLLGLPIRTPHEAGAVAAAARACGLLIGTAGGNTLRWAPPLIVNEKDVERALAAFEKGVSELCSGGIIGV